MYLLHRRFCAGDDTCKHNYIWMVRWLDQCMELSKINRDMLQYRLLYLKAFVAEKGKELDTMWNRWIVLRRSSPIEQEKLQYLEEECSGFERSLNDAEKLFMAMNEVDIIADKRRFHDVWRTCLCRKCAYYRSPLWLNEQPVDLTIDSLSPQNLYHIISGWRW
ncbi:hypothetical protein DVH05_005261 [Phytophthora capsici]|nr:hypothetical protein DVH05_005261 [Phytophthora capsici]